MKQVQKKIQGNFFNCLMANNETIPTVGSYVTELLYFDRNVHIVKSIKGKVVTIQYCQLKFKGKMMGEQDWQIVRTKHTFDVVYRYGSWYKIIKEYDKPIYNKIKLVFGVCNPYFHWEF